MILTAMSIMIAGQIALPNKELSLEQAKAEARFIVLARVGKTSEPFANLPPTGLPYFMWTELKPTAVLKGQVTYEELNQHPLAMLAKKPSAEEEQIFFLGDGYRDFVITKILPKTEANLEAIRSKSPQPEIQKPKQQLHQAGIGGGGLTGGLDVRRLMVEPEPPAYRGTVIIPEKDATGDVLKLQKEFAAAMHRADPVPESRRTHFAWVEKDEYVRRYKVIQLGWHGAVRTFEPRPDGGWFVNIVIRPWLYVPFRGFLPDEVEETYEYVNGCLLYTSDAADD